jgi:hypothetical protein
MTDNSFKLTDNITYTFEEPIYPVGAIYFIQKGKPRLLYSPKADITNIELSRLLPLFAIGMMQYGGNYDFRGYIDEHGLTRHFIETN